MLPNHKYNQYTDDDLIAEYKRNQNQQIIGELYARYGHLVFGVCLKIVKNRQDCEDLTMQIFQSMGTKVQQHTITYFKSWLYQLTRNECLMLLRKTRKNPEFELNENIHVPFEPSEADAINIDCFEVNLVEAMKALKEEQRLSLDLFYKQEKSYVQIAQETQWELNKVKSYIQNAKRNLKILLENMCNGK